MVGFMCSGKTTFGKWLSKSLGWDFVDVDEEVEREEGISIAEIFEKKGEGYFRRLEFEKLSFLSNRERVVISTGGGLGANPEAIKLMRSKGLVVWLKISFEAFFERCGEDSSRPLLKKGREELLSLFEERAKIYSQAHIALEAELSPESIVEEILRACRDL